MTKKRLKHIDRQKQIIEIAKELVSEGGVHNLTIRKLTKKAGITEAALYRHFNSRDDVVINLIKEVNEKLIETIKSSINSDGNSIDDLEKILNLHYSSIELRKGLSFIVILQASEFESQEIRQAGNNLVRSYLKIIEDLIYLGIKKGEIDRTVEPESASMMFFGIVQVSVTRWIFDPEHHPLNEKSKSLWNLFRTSLEFMDEDLELHRVPFQSSKDK